jgi:diacylglycerol kinase (ATP)
VVIVKKAAKPLLLYNLIKQILAGKLQTMESSLNLPIIYFQTKQLSIENISLAPIHIDGDPAETPKKLKIKILPKCFQLIQP